ncbi:MAG TPA: sugar phosphate isomerase/epimerase [Phototrophicaceae bacterium]|nr:sugar phosphate isomerase/epimerase [Phototrophicaceae bacterium]
MNVISFMTANYVARQVGYHMTEGWGQGDSATSVYFQPLDSFGVRFEEYLRDIRALGFAALDLWSSILSPTWATDEQIDTAADLLHEYGFSVVSYAGWFGSTADEFERSCEIASALDIPVLGGQTSVFFEDRPFVVAALQKYGLRFGLENHPEKSPEELLGKIGGDEGGLIGVCADTGWFGTYDCDAVEALRKLAPRLLHVHLKDVLHGGGHDTCRYGQGVVPIQRCVETLRQVGYTGAISVEHEPERFDPTEDVRASFALLKQWFVDN